MTTSSLLLMASGDSGGKPINWGDLVDHIGEALSCGIDKAREVVDFVIEHIGSIREP